MYCRRIKSPTHCYRFRLLQWKTTNTATQRFYNERCKDIDNNNAITLQDIKATNTIQQQNQFLFLQRHTQRLRRFNSCSFRDPLKTLGTKTKQLSCKTLKTPVSGIKSPTIGLQLERILLH